LAEGLCGPDAALGLWMPSVDSVGRYYPLMLAVTCAGDSDRLLGEARWLETAEHAGWSAVQEALSPEELAQRLANPQREGSTEVDLDEVRIVAGCGIWWTAGAPRVRPARHCARALPFAAMFAAMLVDPATPQAEPS
jgi:type VI secretion system protein ImpM